jgi:hypothetical protein
MNGRLTEELEREFTLAIEDIATGKYHTAGGGEGLVLSGDGLYEHRGHHSSHMSAHFICTNNNLLVSVLHVSLNANANSGLTVAYKGSSHGAEGFGMETMARSLKSRGVIPDAVVVDDDGGVKAALRLVWGVTLLIFPCVNHLLKAMGKMLKVNFAS